MKDCSKCERRLDLEQFNTCKTTRDKLRPECKDCQSRFHRTWQKTDRAGQFNRRLKTRYGITAAQYETMLVEQAGKCKLCRRARKPLAVDHDHKTGKVRGLLCLPCNGFLGYIEADPNFVERALAYIGEEDCKF